LLLLLSLLLLGLVLLSDYDITATTITTTPKM